MQQSERETTITKAKSTWNGVERRRVEKVVETLATLRSRGESLSEVAHDARNMVTALALYCDLLDEPGVLTNSYTHYAQELRLVSAASRRLVEKLVALDAGVAPDASLKSLLDAGSGRKAASVGAEIAHGAVAADSTVATSNAASTSSAAATRIDRRASFDRRSSPSNGNSPEEAGQSDPIASSAPIEKRDQRWDLLPALPVTNLAAELLANRNLLAALAGPSIALTMQADGGAQPVRLTGEDLTRLLVNLVKNAAEAMPQGGRIHIGLSERETAMGATRCLALTVEDNGPGIAAGDLERIFASGYTSRGAEAKGGGWPQTHRGLGLAIVRSIVEGAGGRINAQNRVQGGACFTLELPVRKTGARD